MSKPIDFNQKKADKDGEITVKSVLEDLLQNVEQIDKLIVITRCKDGEIKGAWNTNDTLNSLGLLEAGKQIVFSDMWEEN